MIDTDMRRPTLYHTFNMSNKSRLSRLLFEKGRLAYTVKKRGIKILDLIVFGHLPGNIVELLQSPELDIILNELKVKYDLILNFNTGKTEKSTVMKIWNALVTA